MVDHHVDRPGVDAQQCVKLTGPNRSIGSILLRSQEQRKQNSSSTAAKTAAMTQRQDVRRHLPHTDLTRGAPFALCKMQRAVGDRASPGLARAFRWLGGHSEGQHTRSHPELGRENPQRQWYCVSRRGRVGRCQAFQTQPPGKPSAYRTHPTALCKAKSERDPTRATLVPAHSRT